MPPGLTLIFAKESYDIDIISYIGAADAHDAFIDGRRSLLLALLLFRRQYYYISHIFLNSTAMPALAYADESGRWLPPEYFARDADIFFRHFAATALLNNRLYVDTFAFPQSPRQNAVTAHTSAGNAL